MKNKPIVGAWGSIAPATGQLFIMSLEYLPDCIRFYTKHKSSDSVISTAEGGKRVIGAQCGSSRFTSWQRGEMRQNEMLENRPEIAPNSFVLSPPRGVLEEKDFHPAMMSFPL